MDFLFLTVVPVCSHGTFQRLILERGFPPPTGLLGMQRERKRNFGNVTVSKFPVYVFVLNWGFFACTLNLSFSVLFNKLFKLANCS